MNVGPKPVLVNSVKCIDEDGVQLQLVVPQVNIPNETEATTVGEGR